MIAGNQDDEKGCMITRRLMICTTLYGGRYRLHSIAKERMRCITNTHFQQSMGLTKFMIQPLVNLAFQINTQCTHKLTVHHGP